MAEDLEKICCKKEETKLPHGSQSVKPKPTIKKHETSPSISKGFTRKNAFFPLHSLGGDQGCAGTVYLVEWPKRSWKERHKYSFVSRTTFFRASEFCSLEFFNKFDCVQHEHLMHGKNWNMLHNTTLQAQLMNKNDKNGEKS